MRDGDDDEDDNDALIGGAARKPLREDEFPDEPGEEGYDDGTDPCPHCGEMIFADGEWCPKCGEYLTKEAEPSGRTIWMILATGVIVALVLVGMALGR